MNPISLMRPLAIAAALFALAACESKSPEPAAPAVVPVAPAPAPVPPPAPVVPVAVPADSPIQFSPQNLSECGVGEAVIVSWDASKFPGVSSVKVLVVNGEGGENLFAATGVANQKATGPWARAGSEFVLRNNDNDEELARVKIPGTPCAN